MGVLEIDQCLNMIMDSMPTNLTMESPSAGNPSIRLESVREMQVEFSKSLDIDGKISENNNTTKLPVKVSETKIQLSFSVDRLLNREKIRQTESKDDENVIDGNMSAVDCFHNSECTHPNCMGILEENSALDFKRYSVTENDYDLQAKLQKHMSLGTAPSLNFKSIVRPMPIRAIDNRRETVTSQPPYPTMATSALLRFQQQQKPGTARSQIFTTPPGLLTNMGGNGTVVNFGFKSFHSTQNFMATPVLSARFPALKTHAQHLLDISMSAANLMNHHHRPHHSHIVQNSNTTPNILRSNGSTQLQLTRTTTSGSSTNNNSNGTSVGGSSGTGKRKRSWSRAVFSNLQRKGLEIQFQQQKYITKPDRRKLAARLNLTDAQVKVWFQNRRMKWRHTRENLKSGQEKQMSSACSSSTTAAGSASNSKVESNRQKSVDEKQALDGYSSDDSSCDEISENEDEIDVVQ